MKKIRAVPVATPVQTPQTLLDEAEAQRRAGALDDAIRLSQRAVALAESDGNERMTALAQVALANYHRYAPNPLTAIQLLNRAENYLRAVNDPELARALMFQGMVLSDLGDQNRAINLYNDALAVLEQHTANPDPGLEAATLGAIGVAHAQLGDFERAENAYTGAIERYRGAGITQGMGYVFNNLATLRIRSIRAPHLHGPATEALGSEMLAFVDEGLLLNQNAVGSMQMWALLLNTKGDGLRALGRAREALPILELSISAYREIQSAAGIAEASADLGSTLLDLGRYRDAVRQYGEGVDVAVAHKLKHHERRLTKLLADAHEHVGNFVEAFARLKVYHALDIELHDEDAQKKLQQIALREEVERALEDVREHSERTARLSEQNEVLRRNAVRLEGIAYEDALTGLANRRKFEETLAESPHALPASVAVAILDLDLFKKINDTWSHAIGDGVLKILGAILRSQCRGHDLVARIGGEEFALVLRQISPEQASRACERVRRAVELHNWSALQPGLEVTVSIGVAAADGTLTSGDLMKMADERLYAAKRGGRNRVVDR
ncbi:MAG: tetratricopeptide repeat-containing diguanylate cyclase [Betaproteobacteria bacterium]